MCKYKKIERYLFVLRLALTLLWRQIKNITTCRVPTSIQQTNISSVNAALYSVCFGQVGENIYRTVQYLWCCKIICILQTDGDGIKRGHFQNFVKMSQPISFVSRSEFLYPHSPMQITHRLIGGHQFHLCHHRVGVVVFVCLSFGNLVWIAFWIVVDVSVCFRFNQTFIQGVQNGVCGVFLFYSVSLGLWVTVSESVCSSLILSNRTDHFDYSAPMKYHHLKNYQLFWYLLVSLVLAIKHLKLSGIVVLDLKGGHELVYLNWHVQLS